MTARERKESRLQKLSRSISLQVVERMEDNVNQVRGMPFLFNVFTLYGFAAASFIIPKFTGSFHQGFFCDDESIKYPFHENTVSSEMLIVYAIGLTALCITFCEYYRMSRFESHIIQQQYRWRNSHIHTLFVRIIMYLAYSQIGFMSNLVLTQTAKHSMGRLRPHFIDVCKPVNYTCGTNNYVTNYTCTGELTKIREARLSFFSGHSSTSMYSAVFCAAYLHCRLNNRTINRLLLPLLQTVLICTALLICISRINDHWHHWSDVLVGATVGSAHAIYTVLVWGDMTKTPEEDTFENRFLRCMSTSSRVGINGVDDPDSVQVDPRITAARSNDIYIDDDYPDPQPSLNERFIDVTSPSTVPAIRDRKTSFLLPNENSSSDERTSSRAARNYGSIDELA